MCQALLCPEQHQREIPQKGKPTFPEHLPCGSHSVQCFVCGSSPMLKGCYKHKAMVKDHKGLEIPPRRALTSQKILHANNQIS